MWQEVWNYGLWSNRVSDYALAIALLIIGVIVINIVRIVVLSRLKHWAKRTATPLDDRLLQILEQPTVHLAYLGIVYIAISNLALHQILQQSIRVAGVIIATLLIIRLLGSLVEYTVRLYLVTRRSDTTLEQTVNAIVPAIKIVLWAVGLVFLLDNLGFDISAVVAGLGIGGIAVALAAQGLLQDLFSYFSILLDRPFEIGDFVVIGNLVGTVEHIGIKTTRLRSLSGEQLVAANTDLTSSRIQNYKRMERRRIAFALGVTYETPTEKLETLPGMIQQVIDNTANVSFDRAHFLSYGDFSLNYEVVYYVETSDYAVYMDAQQTINLELKRRFEAQGIDFAYPTQVLYTWHQNPAVSTNGRAAAAGELADVNP